MTDGDPWSLIEGMLAIARGGDLGLLKQCLELAKKHDGERGVLRVQRRLLALGLGSDEARRDMLGAALKGHASLCPWCYLAVSVPREVGTPRLKEKAGQLSALRHRLRISETGWRTRLELRVRGRVLFRGREPGLRWTRHGAAWIFAGPFIFAGFLAALVLPLSRFQPAIVAVCLLAGLVSYLVVGLRWQPRPRADRLRDHAWSLLTPRLLKQPLKPDGSAFLAALARRTLVDGSPLPPATTQSMLLLRGEKAVRAGSLPPSYLALWRRMAIQSAFQDGSDPVPLIAHQLGRCFQSQLPMLFAESLLDGWHPPWMTPGARARLRVLVADKAFEAGFEVADLLVAGHAAPALAAVLRTNEPDSLAGLRTLWSQRSSRPWDRCGPTSNVYEIAEARAAEDLLAIFPDLLLAQESPELPEVALPNEEAAPVRILLCARGLFFQSVLFTARPQVIETRRRRGLHELRLDGLRFTAETPLDEAATLLENWFRYAFVTFLPDMRRALTWRNPDRTTALRALGALECPECGRYFKGRVGEVGLALDESSTLEQGASGKPRKEKKKRRRASGD